MVYFRRIISEPLLFFCPQVKKRKIQCGITVEAGGKKGQDNRERGRKPVKLPLISEKKKKVRFIGQKLTWDFGVYFSKT